MKSKAVMILRNCLIAFLLVVIGLAAANPAERGVYASPDRSAPLFQGQPADDQPLTYPIMRMTAEQKRAEAELTRSMPAAPVDPAIQRELQARTEGAALSLLSHIQYTPSERNQGSAGNCWVWAGTGVLEVALDVQQSVRERLSIQYLDSNYTPWAGCGGSATGFRNFYASKLKVIPWSNTSASYQDGGRSCGSGGSLVAPGSIGQTPSYAITSIGTVQHIATHTGNDATNIANIKNILDANKAVYFAFYLANEADWTQFRDYWNNQAESVIWPNGFSCGDVWNDVEGGGHGVLCVGYDDTPVGTANDYWIMLNSWGVRPGRPAGLFRIPMYYNYNCADSEGGYNTEWYSIPVTFAAVAAPTITVTSPNGGETWGTGSIHNITWTSSGVTGNVNIQLSRDGGANYTDIVPNTPNDGTEAWTMTAPVTATALVRVVSVSAPTVSDTSNAVFTIAAPPAAPTLVLPASGAVVSTLTPTLDWSEPAGASTYGVQVSTASTFTTTLVNQTGLGASTHTVPGATLNWNTTYYWRANAANSLGAASAWSAARTFKTALGPPPNAPSGLTATTVSSSQVNLSWTDNSNNETGFKIERKKAGTTTWTLAATVGPNVITYNNTTGLTANTQYFYQVKACLGTTLNSAYSNEANATTWPLPPAAPTLVLPASGAVVPTLTPTLDWNDSAGAVSYGVQVSTVSTFATTLVSQTGLGASTHTVPGATLNWNTIYYWRANATDIHGGASRWSAARTFKTALGPPPNDPSGLTATTVSSSQINLSWTDNSGNENGFKIERKKAGTTTWTLVATVGPNVTAYNNTTGLTANTQYYYRVRAYNFTSNYSAYSNEANATTWPLPPAAPTLVLPASGAVVPTLTPTLDWNEPAGAVSYGVQVSTASTFTTTLVNQTGLGASTHTVPGATLNWNTTYYWRANATDIHGGASKWSAARTFKTALGPAPAAPSNLVATPASSTGIGLAWVDNSGNENGFKIERKKAGTTTWALAATVGPNVTAYNNTTGLTANTQYYYRVRAYNFTSNYSAYSNEANAITWPLPPAAPTLLFPAAGAVNVSLPTYVDWNDCAGANTYGVQISTVSTFTSTVVNLAGLGSSIYTIPMGILSNNTLYYWRANATDIHGGASRWSALRSFRTAP